MVTTKHCSFGTCTSDSRYAYKPHMKGITFFRFPDKQVLPAKTKRWMDACERDGFTLESVKSTRDRFICSKHFYEGKGPTKEHPDPIPASKVQKRKFASPRRKVPRATAEQPSTGPDDTNGECVLRRNPRLRPLAEPSLNLPSKDLRARRKRPKAGTVTVKYVKIFCIGGGLKPNSTLETQDCSTTYSITNLPTNKSGVHLSSENIKCIETSSFTCYVKKELVNASTTPSVDSHAEEEILGPRLASLLDPTSDECEALPLPRITIKTEPPKASVLNPTSDENEGLPLLGITIKTEPPDEQEVEYPDTSSTCLLEPKIEMSFECEEPDA